MSDNILWTGESVFCQCGHHIEFHHTKMLLSFDKALFLCKFTKDGKRCLCGEFRPYKEIQE
jgi:hypothetical protein